jgi:hypothetical protein
MLRLISPLFIALAAAGCGSPLPSLAGTWSGSTNCGGFTIPTTVTVTDTEDEGETTGTGQLSFQDAESNDIVLGFAIDMELTSDEGDLVIAISDCTEAAAGDIVCWDATEASYDEGDDEIAGTWGGTFPVNGGGCPFDLER